MSRLRSIGSRGFQQGAAIVRNSSGKIAGTFTLSPIPITTTGSLVWVTLPSQNPADFAFLKSRSFGHFSERTQPPSLNGLADGKCVDERHPGNHCESDRFSPILMMRTIDVQPRRREPSTPMSTVAA